MFRAGFMKGLFPVALAFGIGLIASPEAKATITVTVKIDGNTVNTFDDTATPGNASKFFGTLTYGTGANTTTFTNITISAADNAPGDTSGILNQQSVTAKNSTGPGTLQVFVVDTSPFTSPGYAGLLMHLNSKMSRSSGTTPFTVQAFVTDQSNATVTPGLQTSTSDTDTTQADRTVNFIRGANYLLSSTLTVKAGGTINDTHSIEVTALPEPATLAMAAVGLPILGFVAVRRRRARA